MRVNIVFEMAKDGGCSCYMAEKLPHFSLTGYGCNPREAKADMLAAYDDIRQLLLEQGKPVADVEFVYHYDMKSFFEYFDFLNISRIARRAEINPSLMRKYASGLVKARERQYLKLEQAIHGIASELAAANF